MLMTCRIHKLKELRPLGEIPAGIFMGGKALGNQVPDVRRRGEVIPDPLSNTLQIKSRPPVSAATVNSNAVFVQ